MMDKEKSDKRKGIIASVLFHALLLVAFLFVLAWKEPNPPLPEYGIELNFGLDAAGTGQIQPVNKPADTDVDAPAAETEPQELEELTDEEQTQPAEQNVQETETTETATEESDLSEDIPVVTEKESLVPIKEDKLEQESEEMATEDEKKESSQKQNQESAATASKPSENNKTESDTRKAGLSQGDTNNAKGDQGDPKGTLDSRALYGKAGGGDGASLSLTGWVWDREPRPEDTSNEAGRIVFEIEVDDFGDLIAIRTIEKTVSPTVEQVYRKEVEKLTFSPTSDNPTPAPRSKGRITFIIRSR